MRIRVTLRIALREKEGWRLPPKELHHEAYRLTEALLRCRETEQIQNVRTSGDADAGLVTVEVIVDAHDERAGVERVAALTRQFLAVKPEGWPEDVRRPRYEIEESGATRL